MNGKQRSLPYTVVVAIIRQTQCPVVIIVVDTVPLWSTSIRQDNNDDGDYRHTTIQKMAR